jgi:predicted alpha/beta-hydrolase family hydrolase
LEVAVLAGSLREEIRVQITPSQKVTALVYPAASPKAAGITLVLGHGAGAGQTSSFMVNLANELARRGVDAVTFNFFYTECGRRVPDTNDKLEECYRAVIETIRKHEKFGRNPLVVGGKSMGGRIASQVAAGDAGDLAGLVLLGYPLHPPGRPERLRAKHLPDITAPMLFIQGSRDAFGTPEELQPLIGKLKPPVKLYAVAGGDHSFKVPKSSGIPQEDVYRAVYEQIEAWLRGTIRL